jgi:hypothetical protein
MAVLCQKYRKAEYEFSRGLFGRSAGILELQPRDDFYIL